MIAERRFNLMNKPEDHSGVYANDHDPTESKGSDAKPNYRSERFVFILEMDFYQEMAKCSMSDPGTHREWCRQQARALLEILIVTISHNDLYSSRQQC
jgi:hypothetical protein